MLIRGSAEDKNRNTHYPNTVFLFPYPMLIFELGGVFWYLSMHVYSSV